MIDYSKLNENEISDLAENLSIEGSENSLYSLSEIMDGILQNKIHADDELKKLLLRIFEKFFLNTIEVILDSHKSTQ